MADQGPAGSTPAAPVALPSEVSTFRMERRKRSVTAPPSVEPPANPSTGSGLSAGPVGFYLLHAKVGTLQLSTYRCIVVSLSHLAGSKTRIGICR